MNKTDKYVLVAFAAAALILLWNAGTVLAPIVLALVLAYMLNPWINYLERKGVRRLVGVSATFMIFVFIVFAFVVVVVPFAYSEATRLYEAVFIGDKFMDIDADGKWGDIDVLSLDVNGNNVYDPSYFDKSKTSITAWVARWNKSNPGFEIRVDKMIANLDSELKGNKEMIFGGGISVVTWLFGGISKGVVGMFVFISYLVLVPIFLFFFLLNMNVMWEWFVQYLPADRKDTILGILTKIDRTMANFFRGKITICIIKGVLTFLGLWIFGIKYALVFGITQAVGSLVPFLVIIVALVPALMVGVFDYGMDMGVILSIIGVFSVVEIVEGFVLTPIIMKKEVGLHPVVVIIVLMIGGGMMGFVGMLIAVPVASVVKILWVDWVGPLLKSRQSSQ